MAIGLILHSHPCSPIVLGKLQQMGVIGCFIGCPVTILHEVSLQVTEFAREQRRVMVADALKLTEANRNTLKQRFQNLVARGHLQHQGSGRGVWYGLPYVRQIGTSPTARRSKSHTKNWIDGKPQVSQSNFAGNSIQRRSLAYVATFSGI